MLLEYITIYFLHEVRTFHAVISDIAAHRPDLQTLFFAVGQLDTWQSIASFRTSLGQYCEPQFTDTSSANTPGPLASPTSRLAIQDARHPLLADAIANSIQVEAGGIAITGSNMSGKTTFLKTIGVNVLFAQTIYTCSAASYQARLMRIISSMNESDDLLSGKSYYLAEAERLLKIVRESESTSALLALIDEPLAGTNSPERLAASREILRYLVAHGATPMLCTHDVELVAQLQKAGDFCPYHFSDLADETGIHFDYQLRPGQNYHGNAIKVLKYLGYPDTITQAAMVNLSATDLFLGPTG
jgi:DNA mismatch repair ATPase MutS